MFLLLLHARWKVSIERTDIFAGRQGALMIGTLGANNLTYDYLVVFVSVHTFVEWNNAHP